MTAALARCVAAEAATFAAEYWSRRPLLSRAKELPSGFDDLLSVPDVDELVAERALRTPFFRTVQKGAGLPAPVRTVRAGNRPLSDVVNPDRLHAQYDDGATLVLNALHRTHPPLVRFCRELAIELGHPTQCNAYVTPGGAAQGFAFHHDTHDVFVLQVSGRKRWIVHEPVLPLPLRSQPRSGNHLVPTGAEPLLDVELEAGDALYLPRGYVHAAVTTHEQSVHLTVGVLSLTWKDVLDDVVALAADDERFRAALPVQPEQSLDHLPEFLRTVADWVAALPVEQVRARVAQRLDGVVGPEPLRVLAQAAAEQSLAFDTAIRPRAGVRWRLSDDGVLTGLGKQVSVPAWVVPALRRLLSAPAEPRELVALGLDEPSALVLARRMLREGFVVPA